MRTLASLSLAMGILVAFSATTSADPITGGGPGGFVLPGATSDLTLWLKGDAGITKDGSNRVSQWADQSGHANHMTQATLVQQPVQNTLLNGMPMVTFDGGGAPVGERDEMISTNNVTAQTIFLVNTSLSRSTQCCNPVIGNQTGYVSIRREMNVGSDTSFWRFQPTAADSNDFTFPTGSEMRIDGAAGNSTVVNVPQVLGAVRFGGANTFTKLKLAQHTGYPERAWNGSLGEVVMFNRTLNGAETVLVDNYLSSKFNLALNTAGGARDFYSGDTSGKGDYDLDVFGIGRIDAANQVTNAGMAGFGITALGNSLDDLEFVLAGHRESVNGIIDGDPQGMRRWKRVWYVDKNNANVDVTLTFDFSDAGLSFDPKVFALLYSPTTDAYSFSVVDVLPTLVGDRVSFDLPNAKLSAGYYTLGIVPEPGTWILMGLGGLGLLGLRLRRRAFGNEISKNHAVPANNLPVPRVSSV